MPLLLQLHAPVDEYDRMMYVFGCNNAPCHHPPSTERNNNDRDGRDRDDNAAASSTGAFCSWICGTKRRTRTTTTTPYWHPSMSQGGVVNVNVNDPQ